MVWQGNLDGLTIHLAPSVLDSNQLDHSPSGNSSMDKDHLHNGHTDHNNHHNPTYNHLFNNHSYSRLMASNSLDSSLSDDHLWDNNLNTVCSQGMVNKASNLHKPGNHVVNLR